MGAAIKRRIPGSHQGMLVNLVTRNAYGFFGEKVNQCIQILFSMSKTTKIPIRIGSGWSRTRKGPNGSGNAGTCTIFSSMSSM